MTHHANGHVFSQAKSGALNAGLFSVKYLFGEANIAYNFLWLEDGSKFLDECSNHVQFSKLKFFTLHSPGQVFFFSEKRGNLKFSDSKM